jgi:hypothetical protein
VGHDVIAGCGSLLEELSQTLTSRTRNFRAIDNKELVGVNGATNVSTTTNQNNLTACVRPNLAFKTVVHNSVLTSIRIDPDGWDRLIVLRF